MATINPPESGQIKRERPAVRPLSSDILTGVEQMGLPEEVALDPKNVGPFLARQSARLNDILDRPSIKSAEGDFPGYLHEDRLVVSTEMVSQGEFSAMTSWLGGESEDGSGELLVSIASTGELDRVMADSDQIIQDEMSSGRMGDYAMGPNIIGTAILVQIEETERDREYFEEAFKVAAESGSIGIMMVVIAERAARYVTKVLERAVGQFGNKVASMEELQETFATKNSAGEASVADIAEFNMGGASINSDFAQISMQINNATNHLQKVFNQANSVLGIYHRSTEAVIRNVRSG